MNSDAKGEITGRLSFFLQATQFLQAHERSFTYCGLLLVDLRGFRSLNRVIGYSAGDQILRMTLERLLSAGFRHSLIARVGNDEFAVFLADVKDPQLLMLAANKIVRELQTDFQVEEHLLHIPINIGYAAAKHADCHVEALFQSAEKHLAEAKQQGKTYLTLGPGNFEETFDWHFEHELREAIYANELSLYYQPKIDLSCGKPLRAEALARWNHPKRGLLSPITFIPLAEQSGLIDDLTKWAIHTALRQLSEWPKRWGEYSVAVNICATSLESSDFTDMVKAAINIWNVNPQQLTLEVTEGAFIHQGEQSLRNIEQLKNMGIEISVDDFGTGYSCLSYFKRLPADELKIDRSFIANMKDGGQDQRLVELIIELGHLFNMKVVAEGIEDLATFEALKSMQCDYAQGFIISRPLSQDRYCQWLATFEERNS